MKAISVHKNIFIPRFTFNWLWLAIANVLRRLNKDYNDYDIRELMGELTRDEARAVVVADIANEEWNRLAGEFWSGG